MLSVAIVRTSTTTPSSCPAASVVVISTRINYPNIVNNSGLYNYFVPVASVPWPGPWPRPGARPAASAVWPSPSWARRSAAPSRRSLFSARRSRPFRLWGWTSTFATGAELQTCRDRWLRHRTRLAENFIVRVSLHEPFSFSVNTISFN